MATMETRFNRNPATTTAAGATSQHGESAAEQVLAFVAMAGAVGGALAGTVWGAEVGTAFPIVCGTLGTIFGSGLAAGACLLVQVRMGLVGGGHAGRNHDHATQFGAVTSARREG